MSTPLVRRRHLVAIVAAILLVPGARSAPRAQPPAGGDPVSVTFLTVGRDGQPILDLKADEVQLRVDGRQRTLTAFERLEATSAAGSAGPALPAPFGTNIGPAVGRRTTFLVIDDASFRPGNERLMKESIDQYLGVMPPTERVALLTTPHATIRVDPTTPAAVRQALAKVAGVAIQRPTEDDLACRTRETLEALRALLSGLPGTGPPPTLIFFSTSLSTATRPLGKMGMAACDLTPESFLNVGLAVAAARAHMFVVQGDLNVTQRDDGLENLAGVTGAQVLMLSAAGANPLNLIALETAASYVATFQPEPSERNGQPHRLELRVSRPDVTVRAATQIPIARPGPKPTARRTVNPRDMLREATVYRDLPLRVAALASREGSDKLKVVAVGELGDPSAKLTAAVVGAFDAKGRLTAQATAPPESLATLPLALALVVPPGAYRIRLAATDAAGRSGSADYDLQADLTTAGALKLSGLVLGTDAGGFKPLLQFKDEPSVTATFEVYGKPPASLPLKLELAATADSPPLLQAAPAGSATGDPDRFVVSGTFPLTALAPGDYIVRAIVGTPDSGEGRVTRTLRKTK